MVSTIDPRRQTCITFLRRYTRPTRARAQALVCGALFCSTGTITAALRALNLGRDPHFSNFHRVLNRAPWSAFKAASILLSLLVSAFAGPGEPLVFGLDDTVERLRGMRITARAIYHDAARSSKSCQQKTSGLRWMSVHLLVPIQWARRVWALPVLTALCPSKRYPPFVKKGRRHKSLPERARGLIGAVRRWMRHTKRPLIFVADSTYAALELLAWCSRLSARHPGCSLSFLTRLRLDAALYEPASPRAPGQAGRPRCKGRRLLSLHERLNDAATVWSQVTVPWYGSAGFTRRTVEIAADRCVWLHSSALQVPVRWVLIRDPEGKFKPQALLSTNPDLCAKEIVEFFVRRWQMEVTFEETNARSGLPGQRQWSDRSIARSTPVRLGLLSLVTLIANEQHRNGGSIPVRCAAWYPKAVPTFSDALAAVRRLIWCRMGFLMSHSDSDIQKPRAQLFTHLSEMLCYAY